jgi:hypothetical protein
MRKRQIERLLREAGKVADETEFFVIGSQAAHAFMARPPAEVLLSRECDIYPKNRPQTAILLDQRFGPRSRFARQHGYFADVVTPELATLPAGWERRVKPLHFRAVTALCLNIHDLVVSKLVVGRLKDMEFAGALLQAELVKKQTLLQRIGRLTEERDRARTRGYLKILLHDLRAAGTTQDGGKD